MVMMHSHLQAPSNDFQATLPFAHTTTSVPPCLQSLSLAAVLQGVNVKLSKLDETLWEIL